MTIHRSLTKPEPENLSDLKTAVTAQKRVRHAEQQFRRQILEAKRDGLSVKLLANGEELDLANLEVVMSHRFGGRSMPR